MKNLKLRLPKKIYHNSVLLLIFLFACLAMPFNAYSGVTNDVCANCHEDITVSFLSTSHSVFLNDNDESCESCHGSATTHIESSDAVDIVNPSKIDQFGDLLCLTCHESHQFDDWNFSSHNNADVSCSSCHKVHAPAEQSSKITSSEVCYDCHSSVRAELNMPSHHPIGEGKLECIDCHGPHGEPARLTSDNSGKELCFSCHAEKEGPFVYEHAPVSEDCMVCHSPHGTVADNLLKQAEPSLCLSCHPMHFHASVVSVNGSFTPPQAPERTGIANTDSWKEGMTTKCTRCHTEVHGSDMPSQTISTGGNALTR
jgi:DmsE family decaheme c-type cytochrome